MADHYNSNIHHRRSIRLKGYDYSRPGAYFFTTCVHNRECLFGTIEDGKMRLNEFGRLVRDEWMKTAEIRREMELGEFVIMPNHIHGIAIMNVQPAGAYGHTPLQHSPVHHASENYTPMRSPSKTLGAMIRGFKSAVTHHINTIRKTPGVPVWQRNYYEHIIRDEAEYNRIAEYIATNPQRWIEDLLHPDYQPEHPTITVPNPPEVGAPDVGAYGHTPLRNPPQP